MNLLRLKFVLILLFILTLAVLALPEFSFSIGNREFTYPSVGFSKVGLGVDFASLKKGDEIFSSEKFTANVDIDSSLDRNAKNEIGEKIVEQIRDRVVLAELSGIDVQYTLDNEKLNVTIEIPADYEKRSVYAEYLTKRGVIEFFAIASAQPDANRISIEDYNITNVGIANSIDVNSQRYQIPNLALNVEDTKITEIRQIQALLDSASQEQQVNARAGINIDGVQTLDIIPDQKNQTVLRGVINSVEVPFDYDPGGKFIQDILKINKAYFQQTDPIKQEINLEGQTENISPKFNPEGATFLAWMTIFAMLIVLIYIVNKYGVNSGINISLFSGLLILLSVVVSKLLLAPISYGLILAYVLYFPISIFLNKDILTTRDVEIYINQKLNLRNSLIIQFILLVLTAKISSESLVLVDFINGLIVLTFANYVLLYTLVPVIFEIQKRKLSFVDFIKNFITSVLSGFKDSFKIIFLTIRNFIFQISNKILTTLKLKKNK